TGGLRDGGAGALQQKRELRELEEIIARIEIDYQEVLARHVSTKAEITALSRALGTGTKDSHQGEIEVLSSEKDLGRSQAGVTRLRERREALGSEREELEAARGQALGEVEQHRVLLGRARDLHGEATRALLGLKEEAERLL